MIQKKKSVIKSFIEKYKLFALKDVIIFCIITLGFHFLFRYLAYQLHYELFGVRVIPIGVFDFFRDQVYYGTTFILRDLLGISFQVNDHTIYFNNNTFIGVNHGCSGVKLFLQWIVLMVIYPGPWKKKLWFIPLGMILIYLTNLFRMTGLSIILLKFQNQTWFNFSHDYIFRPLFYVVIFSLWVIWVEYIYRKKKKRK
ncbi:archaeosortase/exosortase family protein [candidate division KSB1 bacterium]